MLISSQFGGLWERDAKQDSYSCSRDGRPRHTAGLYELLLADKHLQGPAPLFGRNFAPCYLLDFISSAASPNPPLGSPLICEAAKTDFVLVLRLTERKSIIGARKRPELWAVSAPPGTLSVATCLQSCTQTNTSQDASQRARV